MVYCEQRQRLVDMRDAFKEEFGKSQVDFDLAGESGRMLLAQDPRPHVYHVLSYNPQATEQEKLLRLFDGLPVHLKKYFVRDRPQTIDEFTERIKDVKREQMYERKAVLQNVASSVAFPAPVTAASLSHLVSNGTRLAAKQANQLIALLSQLGAIPVTPPLPVTTAPSLSAAEQNLLC